MISSTHKGGGEGLNFGGPKSPRPSRRTDARLHFPALLCMESWILKHIYFSHGFPYPSSQTTHEARMVLGHREMHGAWCRGDRTSAVFLSCLLRLRSMELRTGNFSVVSEEETSDRILVHSGIVQCEGVGWLSPGPGFAIHIFSLSWARWHDI